MKRLALAILTFLASLQAFAATSYQGLWWNSPAGSQSGWGLNIIHQGDTLFATWFTYDSDGKPLWLVMPKLDLVPNMAGTYDYYMNYGMMMGEGSMDMGTDMGTAGLTYTGTVYRTSGPAFGQSFDPSKVSATPLGIGTLVFFSATDATFSASLNNYTQNLSYAITKQVFSSVLPTCAVGGTPGGSTNYSDLWWNPSESGWGVNVTQQGDTVFATWFTYDSAGRDTWFTMSNGVRLAGTQSWSGDVYSTSGPSYDSQWSNAKVKTATAGTASFSFSDASHGTFTATVNGQTITKSVTRQVFATPTTTCQ